MNTLMQMTQAYVQQSTIISIVEERFRQDKKFGEMPRNLHPSVWAIVLGEEVGEVNRALLEGDYKNYIQELIQVAAVALAAIEDYHLGNSEKSFESVCPRKDESFTPQ